MTQGEFITPVILLSRTMRPNGSSVGEGSRATVFGIALHYWTLFIALFLHYVVCILCIVCIISIEYSNELLNLIVDCKNTLQYIEHASIIR